MADDRREDIYGDDFLPDNVRSGAPAPYEKDEVRHRKGRGRRALRLLAVLLAAAGLFFVLDATLFRVKTIDLDGLRTITREHVIEVAGLRGSIGFFSVDEKDLARRIGQDPYLELLSLEKRFPSRIILHLKERGPCANVRGGGAFYIVDEHANVLGTINDTKSGNGLPDVVGIAVRSANRGMRLTAEREERITMYESIMEEMLLQGVVNMFSGIDLSDVSHIYLTTFSGYTADIGECRELRAKLGTLRGVMNWLDEHGRAGGLIDVSIPGQAVYSPQ